MTAKTLAVKLGYRVDQLDWSIAGRRDGSGPNVLSELSWKDIESMQIQLDGDLELNRFPGLDAATLLQGKIAFGTILSGQNQDSDYAADNRTLEWSRSENSADDGITLDISGAVGPRFKPGAKGFSITPLLGYSFHMQDLSIHNGLQTVSDDIIHDAFFDPDSNSPAPLGPIAGLDSSYRAYWYGFWFGLNVGVVPVAGLELLFAAEYHLVDYFAEADWNLREDLAHPDSFEHETSGDGMVLSLTADYLLTEHWSLQFYGNIQRWRTDAGVARTFFADGRWGQTKLNEVRWDSSLLMGGLRYRF